MGQPIMPKRKTVSTGSLQEVTEPTFGESAKTATRAQTRKESAENVNLLNVTDTFNELNEVIGITDISAPNPGLTPTEIDILAKELVSVRNAKDIVEGRESALKAYAIEVINQRIASEGKDFTAESGYLLSPENGVKLSKEVSGGKLSVDIDLLEKILDEDQFVSVTNLIHDYRTITYPDGKTVEETNVYRELNEEALEKELKVGNVGMEQIVQATTPGKVRSAFYVRSL